jgi:hypothetical protein
VANEGVARVMREVAREREAGETAAGGRGSRLRMRRLDRHCFVLERLSGTGGSWGVEGYFNTVQGMCRAALRVGIHGNNTRELLESVEGAEARVMDALGEAVESGALSKGAGSKKGKAASSKPGERVSTVTGEAKTRQRLVTRPMSMIPTGDDGHGQQVARGTGGRSE